MSGLARTEDVSDNSDESRPVWRRSSRSYGSGACVEAAAWSGTRVDVRDSKNPQGVLLRFTPVQWNAFVAGVRSGALGL
jgi:hypothetical protein